MTYSELADRIEQSVAVTIEDKQSAVIELRESDRGRIVEALRAAAAIVKTTAAVNKLNHVSG